MIALDILIQPAICQRLFELGLLQVDLGNLMSTCHAFSTTRMYMFFNVFCLKLGNLKDYVKMRDAGARRVFIPSNFDSKGFEVTKNLEDAKDGEDSDHIWSDFIDFEGAEKNLVEFICNDYFDKAITSFGNLSHFESEYFNQPISSFGKLTHFKSRVFSQPIQSFDNLLVFECEEFHYPVTSFDRLIRFESDYFNHPVENFGNLREFVCLQFDHAVDSFGVLKHFFSTEFDQTVQSFGNLKSFTCKAVDLDNGFGSLIDFNCHFFYDDIEDFDNLESFHAEKFKGSFKSFGNLKHFHAGDFKRPIYDFENLITFRGDCGNKNQQRFQEFIAARDGQAKKIRLQ